MTTESTYWDTACELDYIDGIGSYFDDCHHLYVKPFDRKTNPDTNFVQHTRALTIKKHMLDQYLVGASLRDNWGKIDRSLAIRYAQKLRKKLEDKKV